MKRNIAVTGFLLTAVLSLALLPAQPRSASRYFPPKGTWSARPPEELGFNPAKLDAAIRFSIQNENPNTKNLADGMAG